MIVGGCKNDRKNRSVWKEKNYKNKKKALRQKTNETNDMCTLHTLCGADRDRETERAIMWQQRRRVRSFTVFEYLLLYKYQNCKQQAIFSRCSALRALARAHSVRLHIYLLCSTCTLGYLWFSLCYYM